MNSIHHEVRTPETDYHLQHELSVISCWPGCSVQAPLPWQSWGAAACWAGLTCCTSRKLWNMVWDRWCLNQVSRAGSEACSANGYEEKELSHNSYMAFPPDVSDLVVWQLKKHLFIIYQINSWGVLATGVVRAEASNLQDESFNCSDLP